MKGIGGVILAVVIGIVGAFTNWFYLAQKSRQLAKVSFIGISENRAINAGDLFQESDFVPIDIPAAHVGYLEQAAYRFTETQTVAGMTAPRAYGPGEILLRLDVRTPPQLDLKKMLAENERVMWIPVDTRSFVASLVQAGDNVSFLVPKLGAAQPLTPDGVRPPVGDSQTEIIGPFRILALGNRMGSLEVMKAAGMSPAQENVMAVSVKIVNNNLDDQGRKLTELLRLTNFQQVQVLLHPDSNKR